MSEPRSSSVAPEERARVAWAFGLFFCVFASWYVLRPLRDAMGIAGSTRDLPRLFLVTLGVTLAVTPALSAVVSRFPRRRFLRIAYRFLVATLVAFFFLVRGVAPSALAARAFFVWASVFNLVAIALAWAFMADVFTRAEGVRLFALIGGGGTLGAMLGSLGTALFVQHIGAAATLLVAAGLLEGAVRCVDGVAASSPPPRDERAYARGGVLGWLPHAFASPFLLAVCAYLALYTFTSTVLYLEQASIVKASLPGTLERAQFFARTDFAVNAVTLALQLFVVGRALRYIGIGAALAALPVFTLLCYAALKVAPLLGVLAFCQVARRALDFALVRPAREVLFTVVEPEDKYKAKSFIDTFVYRSGDAIAAVGYGGVGTGALAVGMAVACAVWAVLGVALGRPRALTSANR